jgi:hypothetical protein
MAYPLPIGCVGDSFSPRRSFTITFMINQPIAEPITPMM